jgi:hypothetical protein
MATGSAPIVGAARTARAAIERTRAMQPAMTAAPSIPNVKPILATLFGIPAAAIVLAAARGEPAPVVGDGTPALIALWVLGSAMCALGISSMRARFGARANLTGTPLGLLATALLLSGIFSWPLLLRPIADALGGSETVPLARAAIVGVGTVMALKWAIAWLAYLPARAPRRARAAA